MNNCDIERIIEEYPDIKEIWKVPNTCMIVVVTEDEITDEYEYLLYEFIERYIPSGMLIGIQNMKTISYRHIKNDLNNKLLYPQPEMFIQKIELPEDEIQEENYWKFNKLEEISEISSNVIIDYCKYKGINTVGYEGIAEALINERNKKADNYSLLEELKNEFCDRKLQVLSYKIFCHLSEEVQEDMLHKYSGDSLISELTRYYWEHPDLFD